MKTLKITTHFTPEEADVIYQFLDELKRVIWESYGEDIVEMHKEIAREHGGKSNDLNDNLPF